FSQILDVRFTEILLHKEVISEGKVWRDLRHGKEHEPLRSLCRVHPRPSSKETAVPRKNLAGEGLDRPPYFVRYLEANKVLVIDGTKEGLGHCDRPSKPKEVRKFAERKDLGPRTEAVEQLHAEVEGVYPV